MKDLRIATVWALNWAILAAAPENYLRWLMLATRRAAWGTVANVVMHPLFLGLTVIGMFVLLFRACTRQTLGPVFIPEGWGTLAIVAVSYAVLGIGFVILTSPPLGRFADASAILLPSLVVCLPFAQPRGLP